ncbi:hypothetical protein ACWDU9_30545 [Streptomyces cellulosae]
MSPDDGVEEILARVAETEDEIREYYGIDEGRPSSVALGFPERSPVERAGRLRAALLRIEPDFDLLNAEEGCAYDRLGPNGPPLWETVLAAGRADLARLREGDRTARREAAEDPVRRRLTLRAGQLDRDEGDLALRPAAVSAGLHGDTGELPLGREKQGSGPELG